MEILTIIIRKSIALVIILSNYLQPGLIFTRTEIAVTVIMLSSYQSM